MTATCECGYTTDRYDSIEEIWADVRDNGGLVVGESIYCPNCDSEMGVE